MGVQPSIYWRWWCGKRKGERTLWPVDGSALQPQVRDTEMRGLLGRLLCYKMCPFECLCLPLPIDKCKAVLPHCFPVVALASPGHHQVSFKLNKCTYLAFDHIRSKFQLSSPVENGMANLHNLPLQIIRIPPANRSSQCPAADLVNDYDWIYSKLIWKRVGF